MKVKLLKKMRRAVVWYRNAEGLFVVVDKRNRKIKPYINWSFAVLEMYHIFDAKLLDELAYKKGLREFEKQYREYNSQLSPRPTLKSI